MMEEILEIDLHFNRSSSSHLNIYKVRILAPKFLKPCQMVQLYLLCNNFLLSFINSLRIEAGKPTYSSI